MGLLHPNLVAWYRAEGNANDSSGSGFNGTWTGTEAYAAGKIGGAFNFNGSSAINLGTQVNATLSIAGTWTVAGWTALTAGTIIGSTLVSADRMVIGATDTVISWTKYDGLAATNLSGAKPSGASAHFAATCNAGTMALYINTVAVSGTTGLSGVSSTVGSFIGARSSGTANYAAGLLSDLMIFNKVLSAADVRRLYATASPYGLRRQ